MRIGTEAAWIGLYFYTSVVDFDVFSKVFVSPSQEFRIQVLAALAVKLLAFDRVCDHGFGREKVRCLFVSEPLWIEKSVLRIFTSTLPH
jgi:uncharacterized membrane protein